MSKSRPRSTATVQSRKGKKSRKYPTVGEFMTLLLNLRLCGDEDLRAMELVGLCTARRFASELVEMIEAEIDSRAHRRHTAQVIAFPRRR
jgi:hypothetical protein